MTQKKRSPEQNKTIADKVHELRKDFIEWQFIYRQFGISQITCKKIYREIYRDKAI